MKAPSPKVGGTVILKDPLTLKDSIGSGDNEFKVCLVQKFTDEERTFALRLYRLYAAPLRYLAVKQVDDLFDVRVYQSNGWFAAGRRVDVIALGNHFIFQAPADPNNFEPRDLQMASGFGLQIDGRDVPFVSKAPTHFGEVVETPARTGLTYPLFAAVTEYSTSEKVENDQLLVLELGNGEMADVGGFVQFLEGRNVDPCDVVVKNGWFR